MKVRKKPVEVNAEFFDGSEYAAERLGLDICESATGGTDHKYSIKTLEGRMEVKPGSWIVTAANGERYPWSRATFENSFEGICPECGATFSFSHTTTKQRIGDLWCCSQQCVLKYMQKPLNKRGYIPQPDHSQSPQYGPVEKPDRHCKHEEEV